MRIHIRLFSSLILSGILLASCEGPMGPAGEDANESCIMCHNPEKMDAIDAQYELSDKAERNARTGKYCARCHSTEGFKEILTMGTFNPTNEMLNGTKITCEACHKHSIFDFSEDTISYILRSVNPVYLNVDNFNMSTMAYARTNPTDYGKINNSCANCHQVRGQRYVAYSDPAPPTGNPTSNIKFTEVPYFPIVNTGSNENTAIKFRAGTNFSIHEGANQPDYLISRGGYEYTGKTYTRKTNHSTYSCTDCHFNAYDGTTETGGHTMKVNLKDPKCTACHDIAARRTTTLAAVEAKLTELGNLLADRKVFKKTTNNSGVVSYSAQPSHDFYGTLLPATSSTTKYALSVSAANTISTTTGLLVYNNNVAWSTDSDFANRIGRDWKYGELGAAWNFTYVNSVASSANKAVHNPTYALELLQSSIDWLKAN